jgi:hypothetical protein
MKKDNLRRIKVNVTYFARKRQKTKDALLNKSAKLTANEKLRR